MSISSSLLPEFDNEMASTRKTLERVPFEKFQWRPHEKSENMGGLGTHLANLPSWVSLALTSDSFDIAPQGEFIKTALAQSSEAMLETFDANVAKARAAISAAADEDLFKPWTLLKQGNSLFVLPKINVLRTFVLNHMIHHRAQLGVYLRLNDIPVPSVYGPSADEAPF